MTEPLRVSWSALKRWEGCHLRDQLHRQGKRAEVIDGRVFLPGTLADRAMRKFLEQDDGHRIGQMAQFVDDLWDEHAVHSNEYKIKWRGDPRVDQAKVRAFAKLVVTNLEPFLFARVLPHEWQPELRFAVPVRLPDLQGDRREVLLIGGMDIAVLELPNRTQAWLYDLKATENESYIRLTLGQLIFYSVCWSIMRDHPHELIGAAYLAPACKVQYHPLLVSTDDRRQMLARIVRYCQYRWNETGVAPAVDASKSAVTEEECWRCEVKHACPHRTGQPVTDANGRHRVSFTDAVRARQART
jgi:hypothetical protein